VPAMVWAINNGLINGVGKNRLAPQGLATRAQAAKVVSLFAELK
ncbi:MAG: S-layer homology domain-containing protein, partial [Oscillospiraceae bacterium]|nr:S-layer homology domain-containing protein [Oscillospiraceae bacterium]